MNMHEDLTAVQILAVLKDIFPGHCGCSIQATHTASVSKLFSEEQVTVERAVPKRQREFAAGRIAAREALAQIGKPSAPIAANADRSPRWPQDVIGSISHSADFAVAVVSAKAQTKALGVDVETTGEVGPELWTSLFVAEEIEFLKRCPSENDQRRWATVLFSAKESFFKLQYPLTGEWVDFQMGRITLDHESQTFSLQILNSHLGGRLGADVFVGKFGFTTNLTITGLRLPN